MGQRQCFRQPLHRPRHAREREHEARQQDRRQEHEEGHLHRLELRLRAGRNQQAQGQVGRDQQDRRHVDMPDAAVERHVEQPHAQRQHHRGLDQADGDVGQHLSDHQLGAAYRRGDQQFHVAAFAFAHDGHSGEQHHGHGQDHANQARHDIHRGASFRVVERHHADRALDRNHRADRGIGGHLGQLGGRALHRVVAAVDQDLHLFAALGATALEIRRHHDAQADLAAPDGFHQFLRRACGQGRLDHRGRDDIHDHRARGRGVRLVGHARLQVAQVGVDGVAEQQQLHDRDGDDHRQGDPIAAHLPHFLQHHRRQPAPDHAARSCPS